MPSSWEGASNEAGGISGHPPSSRAPAGASPPGRHCTANEAGITAARVSPRGMRMRSGRCIPAHHWKDIRAAAAGRRNRRHTLVLQLAVLIVLIIGPLSLCNGRTWAQLGNRLQPHPVAAQHACHFWVQHNICSSRATVSPAPAIRSRVQAAAAIRALPRPMAANVSFREACLSDALGRTQIQEPTMTDRCDAHCWQ